PNVSAKILRKGESQKYIIALFWNFDFRSVMMNRFLFGLQKRIREENAEMNIVIHPYQTGELKKEEISFLCGEFHAAIIGNANKDDLEYLKKSSFRMPIILYNRVLDGYCSVNVDNVKIGIMAAEHLYQQGYRKPAVVHGTKNFPGATLREEAFLSRMKELGVELPSKKLLYAENSLKGGYQCGETLKENIKDYQTDSFFCSSDSIALGIMNALSKEELIPYKLGIIAVGNGDPQYGMYYEPPLTVINIPIEQMATECYSFLNEGIYTMNTCADQRYFETELFARKSTNKNGMNADL
ncbi:MAG TPA: substrate-binding domain-containing protein, partial [Lachnospiraceae bacterium]|nr:substrate-binding domain-containing protein [Lachnospiraceae bacterium]